MAVISEEPTQENPTDRFPLLMEQEESHIINIEQGTETSSSNSPSPSGSHSSDNDNNTRGLNGTHHENTPSTSETATASITRSSNTSFTRRNEGLDRRWSPFNTTLWIFIELLFTLGQIISAISVLTLSTHEKPRTPLFAWVVGYATGCIASLPLLYWRYLHRNDLSSRRSNQLQNEPIPESNSYITISLTQSPEENSRNSSTRNSLNDLILNARVNALVDHLKMSLDCFFAVWFVVGNVWIFGGHTSSSDAPNLYRLCIVFLTFSCIGYALPFILCAMICCCLPCIISFLGVRDEMNSKRGASEECINALPIHKFKLTRTLSDTSTDSNGSDFGEGGYVGAGTENERAISGEDAVCCICLARYADNDELRELPCLHFFHTECVDKWLKINASCPLCKHEILDSKESLEVSSSQETSQQLMVR